MQASVDRGGIGAVLEDDLSTEEGLQRALADIEIQEREASTALEACVGRACALEAGVRAGVACALLTGLKGEATVAAERVAHTAHLARAVAARVRHLDLARARAAECQRRVHDLIDLQLCSAGVQEAVRQNQYDIAAAHVARFLSMEPGSVAAAAPAPRMAMERAADTLRDTLKLKLEEAARKDDEAVVERLLKLFPMVGRAQLGVELAAEGLARRLESEARRLAEQAEVAAAPGCWAEAFTRLLEGGAAAVERLRVLCAASGARNHLTAGLVRLQPAVCAGARRLHTRALRAMPLNASETTGDPLTLDAPLEELALIHARIHMYFVFVRRKAEADAQTDETKKAALEQVIALRAQCGLTRVAQELLAHYLTLERRFLELSAAKAVRLAAPLAHHTPPTTTLVDDVFYIARKCIRRGISTGSVDGACAVLNDCAAVLEREAAGALRRVLRAPPPDPLPMPGAPAQLDLPAALGARLNRDLDAQRTLYLAHVNDAEAGGEWAEQLAEEAVRAGESLLSGQAEGERSKLRECAAGLGAAAAAFRAAHELGVSALKTALRPRLHTWAEQLAGAGEPGDEDAADTVCARLDELAERVRAELGARGADGVLGGALCELAARTEVRVLARRYDRTAGLDVERAARRVAGWAGGAGCGGAARERCARLAQLGALLGVERAEHALDVLRAAPRLAPHEARAALATRTDLRSEEINRIHF